MKKKSVFFGILIAASLVVASFAAYLSTVGEDFFSTKANLDPYSIVITDVATFVSGGGEVTTRDGNKKHFNVSGFTGNVLAANESFYNTDAFTGITEVTLVTNNEITVYAAVKNAIDGSLIKEEASQTSSGTVITEFSYNPDYFVVEAGENPVTVTSIYLEYVCTEPAMFNVKVNLTFDTLPDTNMYLLYDFNHERVNNDWINDKNETQWSFMSWSDVGQCYTFEFTNCRFMEFRFEFAASYGYDNNKFVSGYSNWKPYTYFIHEDIILNCHVSALPASTSETTVFTVENGYEGGRKIEIYAVNDFHGYVDRISHEVEEQEQTYEIVDNIGIEKFGTYFKEKGQKANTLLLDQGDTWQGPFNSSYNEGALVTDVYNYVRFDARTIGNHDFDWGVEAIQDNKESSYNGYSTPVLGANIYKYDFAEKDYIYDEHDEKVHFDEICQNTIVKTLENGLKVGVVGVIGKEQVTSISTPLTYDFGFDDHITTIKTEATRLRSEEHCDVVICSIHADQDAVTGLQDSLSNYVDLVLCAHSHQVEEYEENGLHFYQFGSNAQRFGHITLTYNESTGKCATSCEHIYAQDIDNQVQVVDSTIHNLYEHYVSEADSIGNEIMHKNEVWNSTHEYYANIRKNAELINVACKAMFEAAAAEYTDNTIFFSYSNSARETVVAPLTYRDLYAAFPFRNGIYVCRTTGQEIYNQISNFNNFYYFNPEMNPETLQMDKYYYLAINDFLLFHTNANREYDAFPIGAANVVRKCTVDMQTAVFNYFRNHYKSGENTLEMAQLQNSSVNHNVGAIRMPVTFRVERGEDVQETVVNVPFKGYYQNYYPADPVWEGHTFTGWEFSNHTSADGQVCTESTTLYATFEVAVATKSTGMLGYNDLAPYLTGEGDSHSHSFAADDQSIDVTAYKASNYSTYFEVGFFGTDPYLLIEAPANYKIYEIQLDIYSTTDLANFYDGDSVVEEKKLAESRTPYNDQNYYYAPQSKNIYALVYKVRPDSSTQVLIKNARSDKTLYMLYLRVELVAA